MPCARRFFAVLALVPLLVRPGFAAEADPLAGLKPGHPRLLADADAWAKLEARQGADRRLAAFVRELQAHARTFLGRPTLERRQVGRRLLAVSRSALERVLVLAFAYRTT